jgi:hypothetical protein
MHEHVGDLGLSICRKVGCAVDIIVSLVNGGKQVLNAIFRLSALDSPLTFEPFVKMVCLKGVF